MSIKKASNLKTFLYSQLRKILAFKNRESSTLAHLWTEGKKSKAIPSVKEVPIKYLWKCTREKPITIIPFLERYSDKLFVCPHLFRYAKASFKNKNNNLSCFEPLLLRKHLK
jgi:hypothetical protein